MVKRLRPRNLLLLILFSFSLNLIGHPLDKKNCKEFLEAKEIYLIDTEVNRAMYKSSTGEEFTLEQLVRRYWLRKEVIILKDAAFNALKNRNQKFHITIAGFKVTRSDVNYVMTSTQGVLISKGKTGRRGKHILYWVYLDFTEMQRGKKGEALKYAVKSMEYMIRNYREDGKRKKTLYQTEGVEEILAKSTLYLNINDLDPSLQSEDAIREIYPYDFALVTYWEMIGILERQEGEIVYMDFVDGGYTGAVNVFSVPDERLIISGAPIIGDVKINRSMFRKLFL